MNHNCQLWRDSEDRWTRFVRGDDCLQCPRKPQIFLPDTRDFREKVDDPSGRVRVPPLEVRIKTDRVDMIWMFVQIINPVAETVRQGRSSP